ncbi:hypothetical protein [Litchfieldia alkalitelluris]|uniref:hypothetical protein n=1 Tax=Litchfieldia alkalitelluris TaxID=304268 RepID=UPI0009966C62|nr:hypothetical protein [Litchfieldia alkalitelluris]
MLKTVDVGLMANHIPAHKGVISRLEVYSRHVNNQQLMVIFQKQIMMMKNHVQAMNQLLNPNQNNQVMLPPIPQNIPLYTDQTKGSIGIEDREMALDSHFTANAMANENFMSATNMKNTHVKRAHVEMGLQQLDIAGQLEILAQQQGWLTHPNATMMEQNESMNHLNKSNQGYMNMQNNSYQTFNQRNH